MTDANSFLRLGHVNYHLTNCFQNYIRPEVLTGTTAHISSPGGARRVERQNQGFFYFPSPHLLSYVVLYYMKIKFILKKSTKSFTRTGRAFLRNPGTAVECTSGFLKDKTQKKIASIKKILSILLYWITRMKTFHPSCFY